MADNHGNTPAAWAGVTIALAGFVVGGIGLMRDPVNLTVFWIGCALGVTAIVVFAVLVKLGLHSDEH